MKYRCDTCTYETSDYALMTKHTKEKGHPSYHKVTNAAKLDDRTKAFLIGRYTEQVKFASGVALGVIENIKGSLEAPWSVEIYRTILDKCLTPMIYLIPELPREEAKKA